MEFEKAPDKTGVTAPLDLAVKAQISKAIRESDDPDATRKMLRRSAAAGARHRAAMLQAEECAAVAASNKAKSSGRGLTDFERAKAKRAAAQDKGRSQGFSR